MRPVLSLLLICLCSVCYAKEWVPGLIRPLAIQPAIPDDFAVLDTGGYDWVYWGKKDVIQKYLKDKHSLTEPLLRVKVTANVAQTGPDSFSSDNDVIPLPHKFASYKWGKYPVRELRAEFMEQVVYLAYVGLNDEGGNVLMFNLVLPDNELTTDLDKAQPLWDNLLKNTKGI